MDKQELREIVLEQNARKPTQEYVDRDVLKQISKLQSLQECVVISGMRRSGKSTVLERLKLASQERDYFINFEDERLVGFTEQDGQKLLEVFMELWGPQKTLFLDEIQEVPNWERFIRRLYGQGYKIYLTGSNASLFSKELGTLLTGRYVQIEVFPYSFSEYARHQLDGIELDWITSRQKGQVLQAFAHYFAFGGIPVVARTESLEYLQSLYSSILYRDVVVRYKIRDERSLKELVLYLASQVGKEQSYSNLKKVLGLGSATTAADYCHYLESSYLCFAVNCYSPSLKAQMLASKKFYFIDHAIPKHLGFHFSEDRGRLLENIVFIELKRRGFEIFYHKGKKECDFILRRGAIIVMAIQVAVSISNETTKSREIEGLVEAMDTYSLNEGVILTEEESQGIVHGNKTITVMSLWKWLFQSF